MWPTTVVSSEASFCLQSPGCFLSRHKFSLVSREPTQAHGNSGTGLLSAGVGREVAEANLGLCPPQLHSNMRQPSFWVCTQAVQGSPLHPAPLPPLYLLVHLRFPLLCPPSVLSCLHAVLQKWAGISLCLPICIAHSPRVGCQVPITPVLPLRFCSLVPAVTPSAQHSRHGDPRTRRAKASGKVW